MFYYLSTFIDLNSNEFKDKSYFIFSVLGIACADFSILIVSNAASKIRDYQLSGVMDEILKSHITIEKIIFYDYFYPVIKAHIRFIIYILFAKLFFDYNFITPQDLFVVIILLLFSSISLISIGMVASAFTIIFKKEIPLLP